MLVRFGEEVQKMSWEIRKQRFVQVLHLSMRRANGRKKLKVRGLTLYKFHLYSRVITEKSILHTTKALHKVI